MTTRRLFLSVVGLTAAIFASAAIAVPGPGDEKAKAKVGETAPDFTIKDASGKAYTLSEHKGKIVVLQWINPDCPVCRRVMTKGVERKMVKTLKELDPTIVHLTINSTHYMDAEKSVAYLKENEIKVPALIDKDGVVGHLYGARTTPHLFVIDQKGVLRYDGAIDDDQRGRDADGATNYVVNAVKKILAGETVAPDKTRPYGCSVKYAKK